MIGVAAQFSFSVSFVDKLLHRQRTTGSIAAADLKAPVRDKLRACLRQGSDTILGKLGAWLATIGRPAVSHLILWRTAQALGRRQKKSAHATKRDILRVVNQRRVFVKALQNEGFTCSNFVDETRINLTCCRHYTQAEGRQCAHTRRTQHDVGDDTDPDPAPRRRGHARQPARPQSS